MRLLTKIELIECLFDLILELNQVVSLAEDIKTAQIYPSCDSGDHYLTGIRVRFHDGYTSIERSFYFKETMKEEFVRFINRKFKRKTIEVKVMELFDADWAFPLAA